MSCPRWILLLALAAVARAGDPPLFDGLGDHHRAITTSSPEAQRYFDQGLTWAYAFNHDEAIRSFEAAAAKDPTCAMAYWGIALCHGPHINNPVVPEERAKAAWAALAKAQALAPVGASGGLLAVERALVDALGRRYADPQPGDRRPLDEAYAAAMRTLREAYPEDVDIGTLSAEALMDLQPWDLWAKDGAPKGNTPEILEVLEGVLRADPKHPGANHLYIHAIENSPFPEKGNRSADVLRTLVPASGHLVHMPAHIDVQVGRWALAAEANVKAIEADRRYRERSPRQGFYRIYMAHNNQFLSFVAMMQGRSELAIQQAYTMIAGIPPEFIKENAAAIDGYLPIGMESQVRFGRWESLLKGEKPPEYLPITTAFWHLTRGIALAALGRIEEAETEQARFAEATTCVPLDATMAINNARNVLALAAHVLAGEIALAKKQIDVSIKELRAAVAIEDELIYMEPPDWLIPVRHTLGAVLVSAGRFEEAEKVYREDLEAWPENGWSLFGLAQCLKARGATEEAAKVQKRFEASWAEADVKPGSTCYCVPGG
jgi:tetratricopeptide (TPR) repeat protein